MVKEVDFQRKIIEASEAQGGYGRKWSSEWQVGPPDLVLAHPDLGGYFMEVKLLKGLTAKFNVQVGTTQKQRDELEAMEAAGAKVCVGVVLYHGIGKWDLILLPWHVLKVSWEYATSNTAVWGMFRSNGRDKQPLDVTGLAKRFFYDYHPDRR